MTVAFESNIPALSTIYQGLFAASVVIYEKLKSGAGLVFLDSSNDSGDDQIGLDVIADQAFLSALSGDQNVKYVVSEERPALDKISDGDFSVALDPLDGSKSALVGIPSGAIFGIFQNVQNELDFNGSNIVAGGFFVFGINLEVYFADGATVYKGIFDSILGRWVVTTIDGPLPSARFFAVNASNQSLWHRWLQDHYTSLIDDSVVMGKPHNLRWYASMVSEVKRLLLQGGVFAYPADTRKGYENGHLRLVYEAIPMAFLIEAMGGKSSDGQQSILEKEVTELHQKTAIFLGEKTKIESLEAARRIS